MASHAAPIHRFSLEDVQAMYAAGILDAQTRVELVDGVLIEMNPPGPRHSGVLEWLNAHMVPAARGRFGIRVQDALVVDGGYLVPDLMVIEPIGRERLPETALLIVEVAFSSRPRDVGKAAAYAAAGVPEYWIVDVERDEVLVHRDPRADGYATITRHAPGDTVQPLVDVPAVDLAALLAR